MNSVGFIHLFSEFLTKISPILIEFNKNFQENVVDFTFKDKIYCRLFSLIFLPQIPAKHFTKSRLFSSKTARNKFLSSTLIKFAGSAHSNTTSTIFVD